MKKLGFILLASLVVSSCSDRYSSNGENLYMESRNGAKVEVPPPLTSSNLSDFHDLPVQSQDPRVSIEPPGEELSSS